MHIEELCLEVTRMCTLECEHCLRGDRRKEFMSTQTIENVFKDVKEIDTLTLTGGEPLLAVKQMKDIVRVIKDKNIKVGRIGIITNCTLLSDNIISALQGIASISEFVFAYSFDIFHYAELMFRGLYDKRMENAKTYTEMFNGFEDAELDNTEGTIQIGNKHYHTLLPVGRAARISPERLKQINSCLKNFDYILIDNRAFREEKAPHYDERNDSALGCYSIDVNGNVCASNASYDDEDIEAIDYNSNVNNTSLYDAIHGFIKHYQGPSWILKRQIMKQIKEIMKEQRG